MALAGLRILKAIPLGTLPVSDQHLLLPVGLVERVEGWLRGVPSLAPLAQNVIYVCGPRP
jgi:hypothetical protein